MPRDGPPIRPEAARCANAPTVDVDPPQFGVSAERRRLLARCVKEIGDAAR